MLITAVTWVRGVLLIVWFLIHTLICSVTMVLAGLLGAKRRYFDFHRRWLWAKPVFWMANIHVELRGLSHWRHGRGGILIFNHTSWIDILVLTAELPVVPSFGAKIELFRIPFFGKAMEISGGLPIDRRNRAKVLETYRQAESRARSGECFALAPEGTRQKGHKLGKFKQGPFLFAIGAKAPLLPVVIAGAQEIMPKGDWLMNVGQWRRRILMEILPPISTEGFNEDAVSALQSQAFTAMSKVYDQLNQELGLIKADGA